MEGDHFTGVSLWHPLHPRSSSFRSPECPYADSPRGSSFCNCRSWNPHRMRALGLAPSSLVPALHAVREFLFDPPKNDRILIPPIVDSPDAKFSASDAVSGCTAGRGTGRVIHAAASASSRWSARSSGSRGRAHPMPRRF
jgi:hypothetical protein